MSIPVVNFNLNDNPEFIKELRKKVNQYFKDKKLSRYADINMKVKTAFMLCLYFAPLFVLFSGFVHTLWFAMVLWSFMGLGMAGIGLAIMHDANHNAYSKNQRVNKVLGYLVNFIGGYHVTWKIQHNVLHHTFTNIEGYDEDISTNAMRLSPNSNQKGWAFKFQAFYAPFLYGLVSLNRVLTKDFDQVYRYHKKGLLSSQKITLKRAVSEVVFNKIWYFGLTLLLPILMVQIPWWQTLLGFLLMQFISGLILVLVFQPAHVIEETDFYIVDKNSSVENNWAIHQMRTTSNFANGSIWFSWLIGGLNFQIEHHLFPNICHVHYREISPIVMQTAKEFNVPYHHHKTFFGALKSHFHLINRVGSIKR